MLQASGNLTGHFIQAHYHKQTTAVNDLTPRRVSTETALPPAMALYYIAERQLVMWSLPQW